MYLRVNRFIKNTSVEGPGNRFCIWVQGCSRHCRGCGAEETWDHNKGELWNIENLFKLIIGERGIEGVTFLGGEPLEQAEAVYRLAERVKAFGLSVMVFTGLLFEDIKDSDNKYIREIINVADILVDGPYMEDKFDLSRPWVGSSNQRYFFLTERYRYLEKDLNLYKNSIEVVIDGDGRIKINGMGDIKRIKKLLKTI